MTQLLWQAALMGLKEQHSPVFVLHMSAPHQQPLLLFRATVHGLAGLRRPCVGEQNLPPPNISLAYRLSPAENNPSPKDSGRNFELLPNCLKKLTQRACSRNRASHDGKDCGPGRLGETRQGLEIRVLSVSHYLCLAQQTFIYQTCVFLSPYELPSSPVKSQSTTPNKTSFVFK